MTEVLNTIIDTIEKTDNKIDTRNQIDEKKVIDKLKRTKLLFEKFKTNKL
jgi:hypothetical protein